MSSSHAVFSLEGMAATWRGRASRFVLAVTLLLTAGAFFVANDDPARVKSLVALGAFILPFALSRGFIAADIREGRWPILFQNPVRPLHHYAAVFLTTLGGCALLLATIAIGGHAGGAAGGRELVGALLGCCIVAGVMLAVVAGIGSLVRRSEIELALLLLFVSLGQDVFTSALQTPETLRTVISWLLVPINAMIAVVEYLAGTGALVSREYWAQLALYPAAWLAVAAWRLERYQSGRTTPL